MASGYVSPNGDIDGQALAISTRQFSGGPKKSMEISPVGEDCATEGV